MCVICIVSLKQKISMYPDMTFYAIYMQLQKCVGYDTLLRLLTRCSIIYTEQRLYDVREIATRSAASRAHVR